MSSIPLTARQLTPHAAKWFYAQRVERTAGPLGDGAMGADSAPHTGGPSAYRPVAWQDLSESVQADRAAVFQTIADSLTLEQLEIIGLQRDEEDEDSSWGDGEDDGQDDGQDSAQ